MDDTTRTLQRTMQAIVDATPEPAEDLDGLSAAATSPGRGGGVLRYALVATAVFVVAVISAGLLIANGGDGTPAAFPTTTLPDDLPPDPTEADLAWGAWFDAMLLEAEPIDDALDILWAPLGPEPRFDTTTLGTEMALESNLWSFARFGANEVEQDGPAVMIGSVGEYSLGMLRGVLSDGAGGSERGGMYGVCPVLYDSSGRGSLSCTTPDNLVLHGRGLWDGTGALSFVVPQETAVVELVSGETTFWQRPRGYHALFVGEFDVSALRMVALDANGAAVLEEDLTPYLREALSVSFEFAHEFGPEPRFDVEAIGTEMAPDRSAVADSAASLDLSGFDSVGNDILPLGVVQGRAAYLFTAIDSNVSNAEALCSTVVRADDPVPGSSACSVLEDGPYVVLSSDRGLGASDPDGDGVEVIAYWPDPRISVVSAELESGDVVWQRAFGGAAFFAFDGVDSGQRIVLQALDADGIVIQSADLHAAPLRPGGLVGSPSFDSVAATLDESVVATSRVPTSQPERVILLHQVAPMGTDLAFDPDDLGREVRLEQLDPSQIAIAGEMAARSTFVPPDLEAELTGLYHIGRSGGIHLFVATGQTGTVGSDLPSRGTIFQTVVPDSLLGPAPPDGVSVTGSTRDDFSADRGSNRATFVGTDDEAAARFAMLARDVAVVSIETSDGQRLWQRPAGGFALIALPSLDSSYRWELLDRFGNIVDTGGWVSPLG